VTFNCTLFVRALTRAVAAGIVVVLTGGALLLLGWPDDTAALWAWTIDPPMTALVMGAGFASGIYFFTRVASGAEWSDIAHGFLPVALFTWMMAAATLLHWDRFNHAHPAFWVWAATYTITPIAVPALWFANRATNPRQARAEQKHVNVIRPLRWSMLAVGTVGIAIAAWMFLWPDQAASVWPWSLTPLTARAVSGWIALAGAVGIVVGREPQWRAVRLTLHTGALAAVITLIGIARGFADFDTANPVTWLYLAYIAFPAVLLPTLLFVMDARGRNAMEYRYAV
jgi:uncharacterized membrane protein